MKRKFPQPWSLTVSFAAWLAITGAVCPDVRADESAPLQFRLSDPEPFIRLADPDASDASPSTRQPTPARPGTESLHPARPAGTAVQHRDGAGEAPAPSPRPSELLPLAATERELTQLGHNDALIGDLLRVVKWSVVMFLVGIGAAVVIRRSGWKGLPPPAPTHLKVVETLSLGRQMGVHLVQADGDRFLVATDAAGIKSLTLLPSWPRLDEDISPIEDDESIHVHSLIKAA